MNWNIATLALNMTATHARWPLSTGTPAGRSNLPLSCPLPLIASAWIAGVNPRHKSVLERLVCMITLQLESVHRPQSEVRRCLETITENLPRET